MELDGTTTPINSTNVNPITGYAGTDWLYYFYELPNDTETTTASAINITINPTNDGNQNYPIYIAMMGTPGKGGTSILESDTNFYGGGGGGNGLFVTSQLTTFSESSVQYYTAYLYPPSDPSNAYIIIDGEAPVSFGGNGYIAYGSSGVNATDGYGGAGGNGALTTTLTYSSGGGGGGGGENTNPNATSSEYGSGGIGGTGNINGTSGISAYTQPQPPDATAGYTSAYMYDTGTGSSSVNFLYAGSGAYYTSATKYDANIGHFSFIMIYYNQYGGGTPPPPCFNKGTCILCLNAVTGNDEYIPIEHLNMQEPVLVKTYVHGYKLLKLIGHHTMINDPTNWRQCMYMLKKTPDNELTDDLIITGGHSVLVDDLIKTSQVGTIDCKKLLFSAESDEFIQLTNRDEYTYYHLTLESTDSSQRFGIWANGVLTETTRADDFIKHGFTLSNK
jgi:hypothetical protein